MESVLLRRTSTRSRSLELATVALMSVLAAAAWALTGDRMDGMDAGPGTDLGGVGWFLGIWVTMMAAMMLPSLAPIVLGYVRTAQGSATAAAVLFVAGYLAAWAGAGLFGYAVIEGVRSLDLGFIAWDELGPYVAGGVILAAAVYQLTPVKDRCLTECRRPGMLLEHWRDGHLGALRMGVEHGGYCVGCCWAMMAALFAVGVMSITWMFVVAALIAVEKLLPWKAAANRGIALGLATLAIAVACTPADVPQLTIPGSSEAAGAMDGMGMQPAQDTMRDKRMP